MIPTNSYTLTRGSGGPVTRAGGSAPTPGDPLILSIDTKDLTSDRGGKPMKEITVQYVPPSPVATFQGVWVYCDHPDSANGLHLADGSVAADGTTPAIGTFQPEMVTFFKYNPSNFTIIFQLAAPTTNELWRLYLVPGSASVQVFPTQAGLAGASVSRQFPVLSAATPTSGVENAPPVTNVRIADPAEFDWDANPHIEIAESGDQYYKIAIRWDWPYADQNFQNLGGVNLVIDDNGIQTYPGNVVVSAEGLYVSVLQTLKPGQHVYKIFLISYDVQGRNNSLVPGVTPSIQYTVTRKLGPTGREYTQLVSSDGVNPFIAVTPVTNSADGTALLQVDGYFKHFEPSDGEAYDPQFGGAEIVIDKNDGNGPVWALQAGKLSPIEAFMSQPGTAQTWIFYLRSIDINGKRNTIAPGTTPSVSLNVGSTLGALNLGKAVSTSFSSEYVISGGKFTQALIDLLKASNYDFSQFSNTGTFNMFSISATIMTTGILQVGGGGSKVSQMKIFDTLSSLIGFIGDDTLGSGYVGAWFKQARVGGSSPSTAPLQADTSGHLTISGNNVSLSITNTSGSLISTTTIGGSSAGVVSISGTFSGSIGPGLMNVAGGVDVVQGDVTFTGAPQLVITTGSGSVPSLGRPQLAIRESSTLSVLTAVSLRIDGLPSSNPGAGTKKFWYDPADSNRVKFAS